MSNEYKDWMVDRLKDCEYCLLKAIESLEVYADMKNPSSCLAEETIEYIHKRIDLSTLSEKYNKQNKGN